MGTAIFFCLVLVKCLLWMRWEILVCAARQCNLCLAPVTSPPDAFSALPWLLSGLGRRQPHDFQALYIRAGDTSGDFCSPPAGWSAFDCVSSRKVIPAQGQQFTGPPSPTTSQYSSAAGNRFRHKRALMNLYQGPTCRTFCTLRNWNSPPKKIQVSFPGLCRSYPQLCLRVGRGLWLGAYP